MAIVLIVASLAFPLSGCKRAAEQDTVDKLLSYLQSGEYPRIYALLTQKAHEKISLVDFSRRYDDIYESFGLQKTTCTLTGIRTVDEDNKIALFSMDMTADKLGQFKLDMEAPLCYEDGNWLVDWTPELILPSLEEGDRAVLRTLPAKRGEILDTNGEVLAKNDFALSVYVDTALVGNYETLITLLAPKLGMTEADIRKKLQAYIKNALEDQKAEDAVPPEAAGFSETGTPAPGTTASESPSASPLPTQSAPSEEKTRDIKRVIKTYPRDGLTYEQQQDILSIEGVGIDDSVMTGMRSYPFGDFMAQTLGYTGVMSADDLTKPENAGLPQDAVIGKVGLEMTYESSLRGQPGYKLMIVDKNNNDKITLVQRSGADGHDLRLTVDMKLQQRAEMLLREYLSPEMAGSIIVLDPKTGYIQAMASAPSFDPNLFSFPIDPSVWKYMNDPVNMKPLTNRATEGRYPPGSTMKPFTASMGLTDGKITTNTVFPYQIENNKWIPSSDVWDWDNSAIKRMEATPGTLNLQNAITYSDNIFFAYTALKIGRKQFYQHCLDLGFTAPMKFDLPLTTSKITNTGSIDSLRMLADSGYGQGELLITPVQMASMFGALANGGDIMQPRLVESVCHTEGARYITDKTNPPEVWKEGVVAKKNLNILLPSLKRVADIGTAKDINRYKNLKDYAICAKTGTAEIGNDKTREIAWLIGFTTKKMDRLVCVTIEVPATEGGVRIEIAKRMFYESEKPKETDSKNKTN